MSRDRVSRDEPARREALARMQFLVDRGPGCGLLLAKSRSGKSALLAEFAVQVRQQGGAAAVVSGNSDVRAALFDVAIQWAVAPDDADDAYVLWRKVADRLIEHRLLNRPSVILLDDADRAAPDMLRCILQLAASAAAARALWTLIIAARPEGLNRVDAGLLDVVDLRIELEPGNDAAEPVLARGSS